MPGEDLSTIISSATDAIVTADDEGNIVSWNPAAERTFGFTADEAIGRSLTLIIPERFHDQHHAGHARVVKTGETRIIGQTVEVFGLHKDGHEIPIELSLGTWQSDGHKHFSAIIRDISDRVAMTTELRESQERMGAILDSASDAIITIDADGTVLIWNRAAEEMFGRSAEHMIGNTLHDIIPKRLHGGHDTGVARVAGGGEEHVIGHTAELVGVRSDGTEFPMELSLARWDRDGQRFFSGIIRDITERVKAAAELEALNSDLAEKNDMLEGLSAKLAKYLSRQVYDSIFAGRTEVKLESYRKKLTVFFSDIQGFTELTDRMEAEPLSELLNGYLSDMAEIAEKHGGTVDKFIGDGIMIFFGDPESEGDKGDALGCIRMAIEMRERVKTLTKTWRQQTGAVELHVRMGINSGWCTVGNFGSENRMDYTIVGKEVNAAARLESSAESDQIHISSDTYELVADEIECRPVGEVKVKGLAYPIKTYEVIGERNKTSPSTVEGIDVASLDPEAKKALLEALTEET